MINKLHLPAGRGSGRWADSKTTMSLWLLFGVGGLSPTWPFFLKLMYFLHAYLKPNMCMEHLNLTIILHYYDLSYQ